MINHFGIENIKVITLESLISNRLNTVNSCFDFLEIKQLESIAEISSNKTTKIKYPWLYHFIRKSSIGKMNYTKIGKYFLSKTLIDRIKNKMKNTIDNWSTKNFKYKPLEVEYRNHLKQAYSNDVKKIKDIFNYPFHEWKDFN